MTPIYEVQDKAIRPIPRTDFREAGLRERQDLQRLLRDQIDIVSPDTLLLAEEFGEWADSGRRIDLLGLDAQANLVVIELKRTEDGGHMELQALRYAAMVSPMTFEQAVAAHAGYLAGRGGEHDVDAAGGAILEHLGWDVPREDDFAQSVRIVLASASFSKEITTSVLWLNDQGLDIRCVRLRPYNYQGRVLLDVAQVIPLPEASEYQTRIQQKRDRERRAAGGRVWNAESFMDDLASRRPAEEVPIARQLLEWAEQIGDEVRWGSGVDRGSFAPWVHCPSTGEDCQLFIVWSKGQVAIRLDSLRSKAALANGALLEYLEKGLGAVPGVTIDFAAKRPRFILGRLGSPSAMRAFLEVMEGLANRLRGQSGAST